MAKLTLRQWMAMRNITGKELAKKVNVSYPTVTNWRNGYTQPNSKYVPKILEVLNVSYDDVIWVETS